MGPDDGPRGTGEKPGATGFVVPSHFYTTFTGYPQVTLLVPFPSSPEALQAFDALGKVITLPYLFYRLLGPLMAPVP